MYAALLGDKTKTNSLLSDTYFDTDKSIFYLNLSPKLSKLKEITKMEKITKEQNKCVKTSDILEKPNFIKQPKME